MWNRIHKLPSPSMAVAFFALLAALGGTAVALPGTRTVDSGDIRNNSVRSADIRNSTVRSRDVGNNKLTGADVKNLRGRDVVNNSLTGADINEATLSKVPSASTADSAGSVGGLSAGALANEVQPYSFRLGDNGSRTFFDNGSFTLVANCDIDNGANDTSNIELNTTADDAAMDSNDGDEESDFDVSGNPAQVIADATSAGSTDIEQYNDGAVAVAANGTTLQMNNYALGWNLGGSADTCSFVGSVVSSPGT